MKNHFRSFQIRKEKNGNNCPPGSLDKLNLTQLLGKTKECLAEARKVFKQKYNLAKFTVSGPWVNDERGAIWESGTDVKLVQLKTFEASVDVLLNFGYFVSMIEIDFEDININQAREIVKHVNDKMYLTLREVNLLNCRSNALNELRHKFIQVKQMRFSSSEKRILTIKENQKLSNSMPNLEMLYVEHAKPSDWNFIDGSFSNLTVLSIDFPKSQDQDAIDESHVSSFLTNNSGIIELRIKNADLKFLKEVSEHLKQLKVLNITGLSNDYLNYHVDTVQFDHIQLVTITDYENKLPENMVINEIDDFMLDIQPEFTVKWLEFIAIQTNGNSKSFTLLTTKLPIKHFLAIPEELPLIETVYIESGSNVTAEDVVNFLNKSNKLTNLRMVAEMNELEQKKLLESLPGGFTVKFQKESNHTRLNIER